MIYLDNAATTKMAPVVFDAMVPYMKEFYGNPGSHLHKHGQVASGAIEIARGQVAEMINANPEQIIFTSGGTEGNAMVFQGLSEHLRATGKTHIIVSAVEHESVLKAAEGLRKLGFYVSVLPVEKDGTVNLRVLKDEIRPETGLVSIMYVNNELGSVNPVEDIGALCGKHGVLFHTDCVQAAGVEPIDIQEIGCDFLTMSAHKIHGPKGVGAVFAKDKGLLTPLVSGGVSQEYGLRGGTPNVPGIVGFGRACELVSVSLRSDLIHVSTLKQRFFETLKHTLSEAGNEDVLHINGQPVIDPGKILSVTLNGVDAETLIMMLDTKDVCASMGAACTGNTTEPSHVLTAIGLDHEAARSTMRFSFSKYVTEEDAKTAAMLTGMMANILLANTKIWGGVHGQSA